MLDGRGKLPDGWAWARLGEITQAGASCSPMQKFAGQSTFAYVDLSAIKQHQIASPQQVSPAAAPSRARQQIQTGDTLFSCVRVYLENIAQVPAYLDGQVASTAFAVLRHLPGMEPDFIYWLARSPTFIGQMIAAQRGNSPPAVQEADVRNAFVPVAPPAEQGRIAAMVKKLFAELDEANLALARARAGLAEYRVSLLHAACTGQLTAAWRASRSNWEKDGPTLLHRILTEHRVAWENRELARISTLGQAAPLGEAWKTRYRKPLSPDTEELVALPAGWTWACLDTLIIDGPQNGLYLPQTAYGAGSSIIRIDDFQDGWIRKPDDLRKVTCDLEIRKTFALKEGDLVINRVNSPTHLGKGLLISSEFTDALFESNMMRMCLSKCVNSAYILAYLQSAVGRAKLIADAKWAVNQASINQRDVRKTLVPIPPLAEQDEIVAQIGVCTDATADLQREIASRTADVRSLRQSILHAAFTGRLVPQNLADEPAAALLARLRDTSAAPRRARAKAPA